MTWSTEASGNVRRALALELTQLLDERILQRMAPSDLPDHCRECGEGIVFGGRNWTCILNRGAAECTYGYVDDAGVLEPYRELLRRRGL